LSDYEDDEVGIQPTKAKKSAAVAGRPPLKKTHGTGGSASTSSNFLTAAEQRAQATKEEKKSQDDPFSFLLDVRDVGCIIIILEVSVDSCNLLCRKTVSAQESPVMIPGHCTCPRRLGTTLALSRNKYAEHPLRLLHMIEHAFTVLGNQAESLRYSCVSYIACVL
jgi:hypothetical protein